MADADATSELTKQQKKNKKKREAAKKKKSDATNQENNHPLETKPDPPQTNPKNNEKCTNELIEEKNISTEEKDTFEEELCWCIQQIQLGLQTQKPTKTICF